MEMEIVITIALFLVLCAVAIYIFAPNIQAVMGNMSDLALGLG